MTRPPEPLPNDLAEARGIAYGVLLSAPLWLFIGVALALTFCSR